MIGIDEEILAGHDYITYVLCKLMEWNLKDVT